jgi:PAS domain S-box-containing protein
VNYDELSRDELIELLQALEESAHRHRDLYDSGPVGQATLDRTGMVLEMNLTGAAMLGAKRARIIGKPLLSRAGFHNSQTLSSHLRACLESTRPVVAELTFSTPAGPLEVQIVSQAVRDDPGGPPLCRSAFIDIGPRKRIEREQARANRAEKARLGFLVRAGPRLAEPMDLASTLSAISQLVVPDLADLCVVDLLGEDRVLSTRSACHRDPAIQALLDRLVNRLVPDPLPEILGTALQSGRAQLRSVGRDDLARELAGDPFRGEVAQRLGPLQAISAPLVLGTRPIGVLTLVMADSGRSFGAEDLPLVEEVARSASLAVERSRLYRTVQQAVAARDSVLAVVSHDLRNPLHAIRLAASTLERLQLSTGDISAAVQVEVIRRAADRMERLIQSFRDLTTIEAGQLQVELRPESSQALLEQSASQLVGQAQAAELRLVVDVPPGLPEVLCDRERVFQVIANLVDNAIKFTPVGGEIRIGVETVSDGLRVSVADTGCGIPPEDQGHIFDRYWKSGSARQGGTGLGLFIARGIVRAHGGTIWVESVPGSGSRFLFTLPVAPTEEPDAPNRDRARPPVAAPSLRARLE